MGLDHPVSGCVSCSLLLKGVLWGVTHSCVWLPIVATHKPDSMSLQQQVCVYVCVCVCVCIHTQNGVLHSNSNLLVSEFAS